MCNHHRCSQNWKKWEKREQTQLTAPLPRYFTVLFIRNKIKVLIYFWGPLVQHPDKHQALGWECRAAGEQESSADEVWILWAIQNPAASSPCSHICCPWDSATNVIFRSMHAARKGIKIWIKWDPPAGQSNWNCRTRHWSCREDLRNWTGVVKWENRADEKDSPKMLLKIKTKLKLEKFLGRFWLILFLL